MGLPGSASTSGGAAQPRQLDADWNWLVFNSQHANSSWAPSWLCPAFPSAKLLAGVAVPAPGVSPNPSPWQGRVPWCWGQGMVALPAWLSCAWQLCLGWLLLGELILRDREHLGHGVCEHV